MPDPEVIGGIIPGIPMAYMAIRLGSLNILGSIPILASNFGSILANILGSIPILANILGSRPANIFGSIPPKSFGSIPANILGSNPPLASSPILAIIFGSIPMLASILGSIPNSLGSIAIDFAMFFGSIAAERDLASSPIDANILGSISATSFEDEDEDELGGCCPKLLGSICASIFESMPYEANTFGSIPANIFESIPRHKF